MKVAGKCPPEKTEFEKTREKGFENTELYLERKHLDQLEETLENCRNTELNITSVHTPHVTTQEWEYFKKSDQLSKELKADLVVHTKYAHHNEVPWFEEKGFKSNYGYENNPGSSIQYIKEFILKPGHNLVLDTAHLYMVSSSEFFNNLKHLLQNYGEQINVLHLCDSTKRKDGLGFGKGEINMEKTIKTVKERYDGKVTLEVMPENQEDALEKWSSNL